MNRSKLLFGSSCIGFSTFFFLLGHLQFATLDNLDLLVGFITGALSDSLDLVDDLIVAFEDFTEDDMSAVQPASDGGGNKELTRKLENASNN